MVFLRCSVDRDFSQAATAPSAKSMPNTETAVLSETAPAHAGHKPVSQLLRRQWQEDQLFTVILGFH